MLRVTHRPTCVPEREYVLSVVLRDWLGLEYEVESHDLDVVQVTRKDDPTGVRLEIDDTFFSRPAHEWLTTASLPVAIASAGPSLVFPEAPAVHVLFGTMLDGAKEYVRVDPSVVRLGVDVFGTAFFMLTRYEEAVNRQRDEFGRFLGRFSVLHAAGLIERPIVDEQVELLWRCLHRLWPDLVRRNRTYRCVLSCDVDNVSVMGTDPWSALRIIAGRSVRDALRDGPWHSVVNRVAANWRGWRGHAGADELDDFDFLMDLAEQHGCRFVFNFIARDHGRSARDGIYGVQRRGIRRLLRRIHRRGHELGFHGSYDSIRDPGQLRNEFVHLSGVAADEGVVQPEWGGRQHYLRWEVPDTWQAYEDAGLAYDSSLTYPDHAGFRCGTCHEFRVFNIATRRPLKLRERPLVVMEASLFGKNYMMLDRSQSIDKVVKLSDTCRSFAGDFTLLWHNGQSQFGERRSVVVEGVAAASASRVPDARS